MALTALDLVELDSARRAARRGAEEARALVPGALSRWWASAIGADSTASAIETNARAAESLADALDEKYAAMAANPEGYGDADVRAFLASAGVAQQNTASAAAADQLSPATAVEQVAAGTVADIATGAKWTAIIGLPLVALVALAVLVGLYGPRRS